MPAPGATVTATLPIIAINDGRVTCGGLHPTADTKGMQSLVQPQYLLSELAITAGNSPKVGDLVQQLSDGSLQHQPGPPQAQSTGVPSAGTAASLP